MNRDFEPGHWQRQMEELVVASAYPREAFEFALDSLKAYEQTRNIYQSLLTEEFFGEFVHDYAMKRLGTDVQSKLEKWSIHSADDICKIFHQLIRSGQISDENGDFVYFLEHEFQLDFTFQRLKRPEIFGNYLQWRVSTLLFLTTLVAIGVVGVERLGATGGFATLFCSWIIAIGLYSLISGIRRKTKGWILNVIGGLFLFAIGVVVFYALVSW